MKRGRPKLPPRLPSKEQETWLKANFKLYNREHLAVVLGISKNLLRAWCKQLGLKKIAGRIKKAENAKPALTKKIIRFKNDVIQPRPRADHTNMSREQRIDCWLNYPI